MGTRVMEQMMRRGTGRVVGRCAVGRCAVVAGCALGVMVAGCEEERSGGSGERASGVIGGAVGAPVGTADGGAVEAGAGTAMGDTAIGDAATGDGAGGDTARVAGMRDGREFLPSVYGFGFVNSFSGSAAPPAIRDAEGGLLGAIRGVTEGSVGSNFGLCGGMSAAAADYFHAGRAPSGRKDVPREGEVLRGYIYGRQVDSLGAFGLMAAKFVEAMMLPDVSEMVDGVWGDSAAARTTVEMVPILERLDRGELVPLGLVHVRAERGSAAWENHQVLAYGYVREEGMVTMRVYDPNAPRDDGAVVRLRREGEGGAPEQWRGELEYARVDGRVARRPVRTLFAMPYERRTPPEE